MVTAIPADAAMQAAYEARTILQSRRGARTYCLIAIALLVTGTLLDEARFPEQATVLLGLRFGAVAALSTLFLLLATPMAARHPRPLGLLVAAVTGGTLNAMAAVTGGPRSPITITLDFAALGVGLMIAWPPIWSIVACVLIVVGYVTGAVVLAATRGTAFDAAFFGHLVLLGAASAATVAATADREKTRRHGFEQEWALGAATREARESGHRYRSVVDTAGSVIILLAPDGRILEFNHEAERILGWSRAEAVGQDYVALCRPQLDGTPDPRGCIAQPTRDLEVRVVARDGTLRILHCNTSPLVDGTDRTAGIIVCAQDVTERRRAEDSLRESEARLRTVIANAPVVLFTVDRSGTVTFSEGKGLARLGLTAADVIGQHFFDTMRARGADPGPYEHLLARALGGEAVGWGGSLGDATFECRLTPVFDARGGVAGALGIAIDVSERKHAEDARLALERKLLATEKLESLGVLAAGIAHDFNNLLVSVLGNASLALMELPAESAARGRLEKIDLAARRGADLTRQLLAYAGHETAALERVDVNALVEEMRGLVGISIGRRTEVRFAPVPHLPAIEADATQVRQVVLNLLTNAAEAIGDAGGTIAVRTGLAELDAATLADTEHGPETQPGTYVWIEVADTGRGMDAATRERIFDPFFSTKFTGRGLGLATVLGLVRAHRGALTVESSPGRGTVFRVFLPCTPVPAAAGPDVPAEDEAPADGADATGHTVLLVDDEDDVRAVTRHMLEHLGCRVLVAGDGREGVDVFRAHAQRIDAVLVDLTLPRLSGEQAVGEIRRIRPEARVILMSGYSDERMTRRLLEAGAAEFLRKPFSVADLRTTIEKALA